MKWLEKLALASLLLIAGILRVGWLGVNSFGYDEARLSLLALESLQTAKLPLIGLPSSGGLPNFPAAAWLLALPYAFTHDPLIVTIVVALLNTLAVAGLWWLGRVWMGRLAALLTALLAATSPYLILYSRNIWAQNLLPSMAIAWAVALTLGWHYRLRLGLVMAGFLATFAVQVHFAGAVLLPLTIIVGLFLHNSLKSAARFRQFVVWLIVGAVLGGLLALPTVIDVLCCQVAVREQLQVLGGKTAITNADALLGALQQAASTHWQGLLLGDGATPRLISDSFAEIATVLLLFLGGLVWLRRGRTHFAVIALWVILPILAFTRHITPVNPQYLILGLPALFLWLGASINANPSRGLKTCNGLLCIALSFSQCLALGSDLTRAGEESGGIGTPLRYPRSVINQLKNEANGNPIVVYAEGDDAATQGDPAVFEVLLWGHPHRIVDGRNAVVIPAVPSKALLTYETLPALSVLHGLGASDERFFARRRNEPLYVMENMPAAAQIALATDSSQIVKLSPALDFENGVALIGWGWSKPKDRWRMSSIWRVNTAPNDRTLHLFHHIRAGAGRELIAQEDVPMSSGSWQAGDVVLVWADFKPSPNLDAAIAAGAASADIGIYRNPGLQRIAVAPHSRPNPSAEPSIVTLLP